jgi:hypothetical protein
VLAVQWQKKAQLHDRHQLHPSPLLPIHCLVYAPAGGGKPLLPPPLLLLLLQQQDGCCDLQQPQALV